MIAQAERYAKETGKAMQVVFSEHGGYQVFPAKIGVSIGYRQIHITGGESNDS